MSEINSAGSGTVHRFVIFGLALVQWITGVPLFVWILIDWVFTPCKSVNSWAKSKRIKAKYNAEAHVSAVRR